MIFHRFLHIDFQYKKIGLLSVVGGGLAEIEQNLKTVLESSQKMREGISVTENPENAVNLGKNGRQNLSRCQMFCSVHFLYAFYSIRVTHQLTLNQKRS